MPTSFRVLRLWFPMKKARKLKIKAQRMETRIRLAVKKRMVLSLKFILTLYHPVLCLESLDGVYRLLVVCLYLADEALRLRAPAVPQSLG